MFNIDPETGIHYGYIHGNTVPELLNRIQQSGTSETMKIWVSDVSTNLRDRLDGIDFNDNDTHINRRAVFRDSVLSGLLPWLNTRDAHDVACSIEDEFYDEARGSLDMGGIVVACINILREMGCDSFEDEVYTYNVDGFEYTSDWLGGAPMIWVKKSPYVTHCAPCSPCVPNAGDLNSLATLEDGLLTYCVPPDAFPPEMLKGHYILDVTGYVHHELILDMIKKPLKKVEPEPQ